MNQLILNKKSFFVAVSLILLIILSRLTTHVWNFTAVGGVALFSGAYFSKKYLALLVPFLGLLISDFVLGYHDQIFSVYFSYALIAIMGMNLKIESARFKVFAMGISSAVLFFMITNFCCWFGSAFYPQNINGLFESYILGLPFFKAQILSDVISTLLIFECAKQLKKINAYQVLPGQSL